MGAHPNIILMACLTPDGLSRKTMRDILFDAGIYDNDTALVLGPEHFGEVFSHHIMESDYYENYQIYAKEGDLVFHTYLTCGFISMDVLNARIRKLTDWASATAKKHNCSYRIELTANYG